MYKVERAATHAGRDTIVVSSGGKRVGSASIDFIKWLKERVPKRQLRPEQVALVGWYENHEAS